MTTGRSFLPKASKFATALRSSAPDPRATEKRNARESDDSNAASPVRGKALFGGVPSDDGRRSARSSHERVRRLAEASLHRRRQTAQLRQRVRERRRHSVSGEGEYADQRRRYDQHRSV